MPEEASRDDLVALGKAAFKEGRYEDAVAHLAPAAKADLTDSGALALLGASYSFLGRHAAAIAAFERALELKPDSPQAHYNLAVAFEQAGRRDDAVVNYRKAAQLDPGHSASAQALRRLAPEPIPAPSPPPAARPAPARRKLWGRRLALGLLGVLVVAAAGGAGVGGVWLLSGPTRERRAEQRAEQCRSNLEVLTRAVLDYARDHDDRLPSAVTWSSSVMTYLGGGSQADVLRCPADARSRPGYAMNPVLSDMRLEEIGAPQSTILLYEVRRGKPVLRHRGTAFYAFVDGHIERMAEAPDRLWRLKRPADVAPVDPGRRPPPPEPEPEPGAEEPSPESPDSENEAGPAASGEAGGGEG